MQGTITDPDLEQVKETLHALGVHSGRVARFAGDQFVVVGTGGIYVLVPALSEMVSVQQLYEVSLKDIHGL